MAPPGNADKDAGDRAPQGFPQTRWSVFAALASDDEGARRAAGEALASAYWRPIFAAIRARGVSTDEASDLAQDFFLWMVETDFMARADARRGRFRGFVKTALQNYLGMVHRKERALKRGGGRNPLALDDQTTPADPTARADPERALDEAWRAEIIRRAIDRLGASYEEEGKRTYFDVFKDYYLDDSRDLDYRAAAEKHGVTVSDVTNYLMNARRRFRGIVRGIVAETVEQPEELEVELRELFGGKEP